MLGALACKAKKTAKNKSHDAVVGLYLKRAALLTCMIPAEASV
jgi:hypothetical protein